MAEQYDFEVICKSSNIPFCPVEDSESHLYFVNYNGDVVNINNGNPEVAFTTNGQPSSILFDQEGNSFIADTAHQAILS